MPYRCTTAPLAYLPFLNWPTFTSDVLIQFICVKPAAAWMAANSDMTAADVDKSVDAMKFCITDVGLCQSDLHRNSFLVILFLLVATFYS